MLDQSFDLSDSDVLDDIFQLPTLVEESGLGRSDLITPVFRKSLQGMDSGFLSNSVEEYQLGLENTGQSSQSLSSWLNGDDFLTGQSSFVGLPSSVDLAGNTLANAFDDYAGNTSTTGFVNIGGSSTGTINFGGDTDWFRVNLVAGTTYQFRQNRTTLGDPFLTLRNSVGGFITSNDDGGGNLNSLITYTATSSGTHFLDARGFGSAVGSYIVSASVATTPPPNGFSSVYGYGLINAAAAVARAINQPTFANVPNLGGNNWGNDMVNAPEAWARGYTGQGVTVAVIDDGVDILHQDLSNNIWRNTREIAGNGIDDDRNGYVDDIHGWNFTTGFGGNSGNVRPESALSTHGTHVAGTIAASNNGIGVTGVAYNSRIMALKIANTNSNDDWINTGNLAQAIRYAVDNGARVINMSLRWSDSTALRDALAYAASRNVITVSAAGNSSLSSPGTPAYYATQYGLSVGAVDSSRTIASFSNRAGTNSSMQHVMAPGVNVYSTLPGNRYASYNGTSMAAPHVAGVVALMLGANPNLTHAQVRSILTSSAVRLA
ncbi:MAG: peptidase S8 [Microcystis aeruginosa Ma_QC_B_20070730_S2]|uniref:Peptidase S8 n=1 Tax=Microcystis aeruginosa Ma_QC_B_20070730_S2 TaxID=2486256 RepID=A0A552DX36_MICAE|nr:MAG: peptidase S8 [Microcystis aeruginosa Ma_QC_B_20070730_S2]